MIVLDTNVLSEPLRRQPDDAVLEWLQVAAGEAAITSISVGELLVGARRLPVGRRRDALLSAVENIVDNFGAEILAYDSRAATAYAALQERRAAMGRPLSVEDGMIAAICVSAGASLATRNTKDFVGLGLDLIDPWANV
ncbi:VapC toxin family PIN domain ribonuclease [Subtercola sp. Z020]|uniref:type II toxin-antitoxin system VapC family toxin n=1 Tax=Subtercola sp. Z020 TaxID=2080582 RepID=UPI000CE86EA4|nr:type II toxin-antitoxin system VapC family toxin [Subtercola sp. Z020]PPF78924.1 VapC toxin family PIN domain ribonuclease [Subtercola sp. Z020]